MGFPQPPAPPCWNRTPGACPQPTGWGWGLQTPWEISCSTIFIVAGLFAVNNWLCAEKTLFLDYLVLSHESIWLDKENERGREKHSSKQSPPPPFPPPCVPCAVVLPLAKPCWEAVPSPRRHRPGVPAGAELWGLGQGEPRGLAKRGCFGTHRLVCSCPVPRRAEPRHVAWLLRPCPCRRWWDGGDVTSPSSRGDSVPGWSRAGETQKFHQSESENCTVPECGKGPAGEEGG